MDSIYISIILYISAICLVLVDLYVPSAGTLLVLSLVSAVGSVVFGFQSGTTAGMTMLTLVAATIPILGIVAIRIWPHTPIGRRIVLGLPPESPSITTDKQSILHELIGNVVVSEYPLMPSGQITINHRAYNAYAEAGYIEAGWRVEIVGVRQRELIVRVTDKPLTASERNDQHRTKSQRELAGNPNILDVPANELGLDSIDD